MPNTLSKPGPYDPLAKLDPDEPFFAIVAHDPFAPATVDFWVDLMRHDLVKKILDLKPKEKIPDYLQEKLKQCSEAELVSMEMRRFQKGHPESDSITTARATYSGSKKSAAEMEELNRKKRHNEAIRNLSEAAFLVCNASEIFDELGTPTELPDVLEKIKIISDSFSIGRKFLKNRISE